MSSALYAALGTTGTLSFVSRQTVYLAAQRLIKIRAEILVTSKALRDRLAFAKSQSAPLSVRHQKRTSNRLDEVIVA